MKRILIHLLAVLSAPIILSSCGQTMTAETEALDEYFDSISTQFMGTVVVSQHGKTVYSKSVGYADIEAQIPSGPDSKYLIGSVSKTMTAVMAFRAIDAGLMSQDSTLESFFPGWGLPNADKIKIDDLLYHRSGLHDIFEHDDYYEWYTSYHSREDILTKLAASKSDFEPGDSQDYCNAGFVLLSYILEDIYGKTFAQLVNDEIAVPAKLKNTYVPKKLDHSNNECRSYKYDDGWAEDAETSLSFPLGAGSIISTPADLNKFFNALFAGKYGNGIIERMSEIWGNFGRGLLPFFYYADKGMGHPGGIDSFVTELCRFERGELTVSICTNGLSININDVLATVLGTYLPQN